MRQSATQSAARDASANDRAVRPPRYAAVNAVLRDGELNPTGRLAWYLTAYSAREGYAFAGRRTMLESLGMDDDQFYDSLGRLERWGMFRRTRVENDAGRVSVRYHPILLDGEDLDDFCRRLRTDPRLDLCVRLHWTAAMATQSGGARTLGTRSVRGPASREAMRQARRKMDRLGHFSTTPGRGSGSTVYKREYREEGNAEGNREGKWEYKQNPDINTKREDREGSAFSYENGGAEGAADRGGRNSSPERGDERPDSSPHPGRVARGETRNKAESGEDRAPDREPARRRGPVGWDAGLWARFAAAVCDAADNRAAFAKALWESGRSVIAEVLDEAEEEGDEEYSTADFMSECGCVRNRWSYARRCRA